MFPFSVILTLLTRLLPAPRKGVEERRDDCLFFFGSSTEKTWIVPWLEDAHNRVESELKIWNLNLFPFCFNLLFPGNIVHMI